MNEPTGIYFFHCKAIVAAMLQYSMCHAIRSLVLIQEK